LLRDGRQGRGDGEASRRQAVERPVGEHGRHHRVFQRFGLKAGVDAQVGTEIRNVDPGEAVPGLKGDQRYQGEQEGHAQGDAEEGCERAPATRRGTHRNPMLSRPGYGNRFPARGASQCYDAVTVAG
jgi:hypothetical protein